MVRPFPAQSREPGVTPVAISEVSACRVKKVFWAGRNVRASLVQANHLLATEPEIRRRAETGTKVKAPSRLLRTLGVEPEPSAVSNSPGIARHRPGEGGVSSWKAAAVTGHLPNECQQLAGARRSGAGDDGPEVRPLGGVILNLGKPVARCADSPSSEIPMIT